MYLLPIIRYGKVSVRAFPIDTKGESTSPTLAVRVLIMRGRLFYQSSGYLLILISMSPSSSHFVRLSLIRTKPGGSNVRKKN